MEGGREGGREGGNGGREGGREGRKEGGRERGREGERGQDGRERTRHVLCMYKVLSRVAQSFQNKNLLPCFLFFNC